MSLHISGSYSWWTADWITVPLKAGTNTIKLTTIGWGGPHLDRFDIL